MYTTEMRHVKRARKRYRCDWCYEWIEKGESYDTWFTYGENVTARLHLECTEAMHKVGIYDGDEMPEPGYYRRGCRCGEKKEICKCRT